MVHLFSPDLLGLLLLPCVALAASWILLLPPHKRGLFRGKSYVMPPGPKGSPLIGSLADWLRARNGGTMLKWLVKQGQQGEMTTLSMGTKTWVLLNSSRVVNEIIAKRASITHERPYFPIAGGLVSQNNRFFLYKSADWKEGRRLVHQLLMGAGSKNHGQFAEAKSLGLLRDYMDDPERWYMHHYRYTMEIMSEIVTSTPLNRSSEELKDLQLVTSSFLTAINSSYVEFYPHLALLPKFLQPWRKRWEQMGNFHNSVFKHWWANMKPLRSDDADPSFVRDEAINKYSGDDEKSMYLTMFVISAGADNSRMAMNAFVMACLAYPSVLQKAREEVEGICGNDAARLPVLDDLSSAPYMSAVIKELLRWRPVVPLIPQRVLVQDMEFEGYKFPAGTEFLINSIAVCNKDHEDPGRFMPERWLQDKGEAGDIVEQNLWQFAFSGGRRSCLGYRLAQKELFVAFARMLYCFDFTPVGDFDDKKLNAFQTGEPFKVGITPRSRAHAELIRDAAMSARKTR